MFRKLIAASACLVVPSIVHAQGGPPESVEFTGGRGSISTSVAIPANTAFVWTSGTTPSPADPNSPAGNRARYGDTKTQAISVFNNLDRLLKTKGLSLKDVVYLRAYLVPDKEKGGTLDVQGWNDAYGQFFNTADNPVKVARSTVGVAALVNPDLLVEVEAFAVYPKK